MKLYVISQNDQRGYDTCDSAVVAAENEDDARNILPGYGWDSSTWTKYPERVDVECIGTAIKGTKAGIICASFNAG